MPPDKGSCFKNDNRISPHFGTFFSFKMSLNLQAKDGGLKVLVCSDSSPYSLNAITFTIVHILQPNDILQIYSSLQSSDTTDAHETQEEYRRDAMVKFHDFTTRTMESAGKQNKFEIK
jgi:hypothetical protein